MNPYNAPERDFREQDLADYLANIYQDSIEETVTSQDTDEFEL